VTTDRYTRTDYAIGLVTYHPHIRLLNRINRMIALGFRVYLFDNSPCDEFYTQSIKSLSSVLYFTAGKNVGIGFALSTLCATAYAHGFERLLFLDQDTGISAVTLEFIETCIKRQTTQIPSEYAALVFSGKAGPYDRLTEVSLAISSGSLFNLPLLKSIGWHNHHYFVDCVDYELCVRARRNGYRIGVIHNTPDFDHVSEQPDRTIKLFGKQLLVRRYPASRIKDATSAYMKLILGGLLKNRPGDTYALSRSLALYVLGQLMARVTPNRQERSSENA
jgi:GT2 family glycosyltransferase